MARPPHGITDLSSARVHEQVSSLLKRHADYVKALNAMCLTMLTTTGWGDIPIRALNTSSLG